MVEDKQIYDVQIFRPDYTAETYQEVRWHGIVRMDGVDLDRLTGRCVRAMKGGHLTNYAINLVTPPIPIEDLDKHLPVGFQEILGYSKSNSIGKAT